MRTKLVMLSGLVSLAFGGLASATTTTIYFKSAASCNTVNGTSATTSQYTDYGWQDNSTGNNIGEFYCPIDFVFNSAPGLTFTKVTGVHVTAHDGSTSNQIFCRTEVENWDESLYYSAAALSGASFTGATTMSVPDIADSNHPNGYYPIGAHVYCSLPSYGSAYSHLSSYYYSVNN